MNDQGFAEAWFVGGPYHGQRRIVGPVDVLCAEPSDVFYRRHRFDFGAGPLAAFVAEDLPAIVAARQLAGILEARARRA